MTTENPLGLPDAELSDRFDPYGGVNIGKYRIALDRGLTLEMVGGDWRLSDGIGPKSVALETSEGMLFALINKVEMLLGWRRESGEFGMLTIRLGEILNLARAKGADLGNNIAIWQEVLGMRCDESLGLMIRDSGEPVMFRTLMSEAGAVTIGADGTEFHPAKFGAIKGRPEYVYRRKLPKVEGSVGLELYGDKLTLIYIDKKGRKTQLFELPRFEPLVPQMDGIAARGIPSEEDLIKFTLAILPDN